MTGRLWLCGRDQPLELELTGDAWRDLAGRRMEFTNPSPRRLPIVGAMATRQRGLVGDFTASRKIKIHRAGGWLPGAGGGGRRDAWSWSNGLYLEWFNLANERVLIEAVSYRFSISPEAAWEMTAAEEQRQRELNEAARKNHRARLLAAEDLGAGEDYGAEWEQERSAGEGRVEEAPTDVAGGKGEARPEMTIAASTMADVGDALRAAARMIQDLDTAEKRPTALQCEGAIERLGVVKRELERVRLVVEFCRREKLAERAWIDEVQREVGLHAAECERLLAELRMRLKRER